MYKITSKHIAEFQGAMRIRLREGMHKTPLSPSKLKSRLKGNLRRGDYIDVANYALMLDASKGQP